MNPELKKIVEEQFRTIPGELQEVLLAKQTSAEIQRIAKDSGLSPDKTATFEFEVMLLLLGLALPKEFVGNLSRELNIPVKDAETVAKKVDVRVISPVRHIIKYIQDKFEASPTPHNLPPKPPTSLIQQKPAFSKADSLKPSLEKTVSVMQISTIPNIETPKTPPPPLQQSGPIPNIRTMPRDVARFKLEESVRLPKEEISMRYKSEEA